jgi:hypothetical protein
MPECLKSALGDVSKWFILIDLQAGNLPKLQVTYHFGSLKSHLMHSFANG